MKLTIIAVVVSVSVFMLSTSLFSDGHNAPTDTSKQVEAEMKETFGTVPVMLKFFLNICVLVRGNGSNQQ